MSQLDDPRNNDPRLWPRELRDAVRRHGPRVVHDAGVALFGYGAHLAQGTECEQVLAFLADGGRVPEDVFVAEKEDRVTPPTRRKTDEQDGSKQNALQFQD
jgi:hypothetical protein